MFKPALDVDYGQILFRDPLVVLFIFPIHTAFQMEIIKKLVKFNLICGINI